MCRCRRAGCACCCACCCTCLSSAYHIAPYIQQRLLSSCPRPAPRRVSLGPARCPSHAHHADRPHHCHADAHQLLRVGTLHLERNAHDCSEHRNHGLQAEGLVTGMGIRGTLLHWAAAGVTGAASSTRHALCWNWLPRWEGRGLQAMQPITWQATRALPACRWPPPPPTAQCR